MINPLSAAGSRFVTVMVWAGVAISGWYWTQVGLSTPARAATDIAAGAPATEGDHTKELARLLGAVPRVTVVPATAERFSLQGVIAGLVGRDGAALISVDGKPARPFAVNSQIAPGYVLVGVGPREAMLADAPQAPVRVVLSLPALPDAVAPVALQRAEQRVP